jgi:hypothetical protein
MRKTYFTLARMSAQVFTAAIIAANYENLGQSHTMLTVTGMLLIITCLMSIEASL